MAAILSRGASVDDEGGYPPPERGGPRHVQYVWLSCEQPEEMADVSALCANSQKVLRPVRIAEPCPPEEVERWRSVLGLLVRKLPAPYLPGEWDRAWSDVEALINASFANQRLRLRHTGVQYWPALLVTDRKKLVLALSDNQFRDSLCKATLLKMGELLPVLLPADFGHVSGLVLQEQPLERCQCGVLPFSSASPDKYRGKLEELGLGTYMQKYTAIESDDTEVREEVLLPTEETAEAAAEAVERQASGGEEAAEGEDPPEVPPAAASPPKIVLKWWPKTYGARCLSLFDGGLCAYCAVSPDGTCSVEAGGTWKVLNGHIVLGGLGGQSSLGHWRLAQDGSSTPRDDKAVVYEDSFHLSVEDLKAYFEPPVALGDVMPTQADFLRWKMDGKAANRPMSQASSRPSSATSSASPAAARMGPTTPMGAFSSPMASPAHGRLRAGTISGGASLPTHSLLSMGRAENFFEGAAGMSQDMFAAPQLLGVKREIITDKPLFRTTQNFPTMTLPSLTQRDASRMSIQKLLQYAARYGKKAENAPMRVMTSFVKPGFYFFEQGLPGSQGHRLLKLTLHADGTCSYYESSKAGVMKTLPGAKDNTLWTVREVPAGTVVELSGRDLEQHCYMIRSERGLRATEKLVRDVEIPVPALLERCEYTPFRQILQPFPGHSAGEVDELVFGLVHPKSPVIKGLSCRADRIPFHAFQSELRKHGLDCDEILTDFKFIDTNADGEISVAELRGIEAYGCSVTSPEVLHELRGALLERFTTLEGAWDEILHHHALPSGSRVSKAQFEDWLKKVPHLRDRPGAAFKLGDNKPMKKWLESTGEEEFDLVFDSLDVDREGELDVDAFTTLALHTALLAVRRLEHFQGWMLECFGKDDNAMDRVYTELGKGGKAGLTRSSFVPGVLRLGYPCKEEVLHSVFGMIDRNFDGVIAAQDFKILRDLSAEKTLESFQALKKFVAETFGSIDECFEKMLLAEQKHQKTEIPPRAVSYDIFVKTFKKAGLFKSLPDIDIKTLYLFLDEATGKHADGLLNASEWALMKGFSVDCLSGNPARLRKLLHSKFGGIDAAFTRMHKEWLRAALVKGLRNTALRGLARAFASGLDAGEGVGPVAGARGTGRSAVGTARAPRLGKSSSLPQLAPSQGLT
eukprot:TRINITY_DN38054_c0_g1_i1.p1 TRINITY_DN38054_c0_g1~~TRINITY_DN38054_c0_g1_i1.p1  ORF type:complete len:1144 (+),score=237.42 TRINITY_DN38054_c0_g1_i1:70-3501(+)